MSYGERESAGYHRAATLVDKILRGAKPAELPAEYPSEFDFALNVQAARALGLTLRPEVGAQVTDWVQ